MMKAVVYGKGALPEYVEVNEPLALNEKEIVISVKAVAIKHFDIGRAAGSHYSAPAGRQDGRIIGGDGVGCLADGTRVYGMAVSGMLAERATIYKDRMVKVPDELDDATAAALPNAVIGAAMALRFKAGIKNGDTVLINGATGFTGRVAVQIAKLYGAGKVIVTGRNQESLNQLIQVGADETISLSVEENDLLRQLKSIHMLTPIDVVIDYLWGHSAELILAVLKGDGSFTRKLRYVSVGSITGDIVRLSAAVLRSINLQLSGSGLGAWAESEVNELFRDILPEMFAYAAKGKLKIKTTSQKLEDIAGLWNLEITDGKRLVIMV